MRDSGITGASAVRLIIKIILIEYFLRAVTVSTSYKMEDSMKDELMHNYIFNIIKQVLDSGLYSPGTDINEDGKIDESEMNLGTAYTPSDVELKKLIREYKYFRKS